jgi:L-fucose mutarotase
VLPLDFFVDSPVSHMVPQAGVAMPPAGLLVAEACAQTVLRRCPGVSISFIERFKFYDEARNTFAVVQTLERRPYGNCILVKGVIGPDGEDLRP